jgi:hypothetical protein
MDDDGSIFAGANEETRHPNESLPPSTGFSADVIQLKRGSTKFAILTHCLAQKAAASCLPVDYQLL